jgi:hypothetical protein
VPPITMALVCDVHAVLNCLNIGITDSNSAESMNVIPHFFFFDTLCTEKLGDELSPVARNSTQCTSLTTLSTESALIVLLHFRAQKDWTW